MDGFDNILQKLGKYFFPTLTLVFGGWMLAKGLSKDAATGVEQTSSYVYAGLFVVVMSLLMFLFIAGILKRKMALLLAPILIGLCAWFIYMNYVSIKDRMDKMTEVEQYRDYVKQGLLDIRDIEVEFQNKYQRYSSDAVELQAFLTKDFVEVVLKDDKATPDRKMTDEEAVQLGYDKSTVEGERAAESINEAEAVALGLRQFDTVQVPVMDYIFNGAEVKVTRDGKPDVEVIRPVSNPEHRAYEFDVNKLWKKTMGDQAEYFMAVDDIGDTLNARPVFVIRDPSPYDPLDEKLDTLVVGSLKKHNIEGNWKD